MPHLFQFHKVAVMTFITIVTTSTFTHAASIPLDITKSKDANIKVYNTFFGFQVGDPIFSMDLPAGDTLKTTVSNNSFFSGLSTVQTLIKSTGVDVKATNTFENVEPDPLNPGLFWTPLLNDYLFLMLADNGGTLLLPDLGSESGDIYVYTDIGDYLTAGNTALVLGSNISFVNGISPELPGVYAGNSPLTFDSTLGIVNSAPFTGTAFALGNITLSAVPEPSTFVMLGLGAVSLFGSRIRKVRRLFSATK